MGLKGLPYITEIDQPPKETKQYSNLANTERRKIKIDDRDLRIDSEMDTDTEDVQKWILAKSTKLKDFKKRKISELNNNNIIFSAPTPTKWLQEIPISNSFNLLEDSTETQNNTEKQVETKAVKPPPIYIEAEVIDPLLELLDETAGRNNYIIKQLKENQVKVQTSTPDMFRKVINALKNKNAGYHTKKVMEKPILDEAYKDNHFNKQNVNANTDNIPVFEHNKPIRSYADVTKRTCMNTKDINSDINTEETSDLKELLKQSIKNTEIITTMIIEQNSLLKQQTQQITAMLQLLTKTLLNNK
ncbi:hypothetical protein M0804_013166 [Polistes exclamans]|nr:hypothetical protein M0804_013166 [Polistes exclamans]